MNSRTLWASGVVAAGIISGVVMFAASPGVPCIQGQNCNLSALNVKNAITNNGKLLSANRSLSVLDFGADPTGTVNSLNAFVTALANAPDAGELVQAPNGKYFIDGGFTIPINTRLELMTGASLLMNGAITLNSPNTSLIGATGGLSALTPSDSPKANIVWVGANGIDAGIVQVAVAQPPQGNAIGITVSGISIDANSVPGVTGLTVGSAAAGAAFSNFEHITIYNADRAINVPASTEQCWFSDLDLRNTNNNGVSSSWTGIEIGGDNSAGGITTLWFTKGSLEGWGTAIKIGDKSLNGLGGGSYLVFKDFVIESEGLTNPSGPLVTIDSSSVISLVSNYFESSLSYQTNLRAISLGSTTANDVPYSVTMLDNRISGFQVGIEGFAWDEFFADGNDFDISVPDAGAFLNTGGGTRRLRGRWNNLIRPSATSFEILGGLGGFDTFHFDNFTGANSFPAPIENIQNLTAKDGGFQGSLDVGAGLANYIQIKGANSGSASSIGLNQNSSDTNPNLLIPGKGTGQVRFCGGQNYLAETCNVNPGDAIVLTNICNDAACNFRLNPSGGAIGIPNTANASLLTCTASTWSATQVGAGAISGDSTNKGFSFCDGTSWRTHITGQITMSGGSGTAIVPANSICVCVDTQAVIACQPTISGTTLTVTVTAGGSNVVNYSCN